MSHIDKIIEREFGEEGTAPMERYGDLDVILVSESYLRALLQEVTEEYRKDVANLRLQHEQFVTECHARCGLRVNKYHIGNNERQSLVGAIAAEGK